MENKEWGMPTHINAGAGIGEVLPGGGIYDIGLSSSNLLFLLSPIILITDQVFMCTGNTF